MGLSLKFRKRRAAMSMGTATAMGKRSVLFTDPGMNSMARAMLDDEPETVRARTFAAYRRCWEQYLGLLDNPPERLDIPYEGTTMPGCFFAAGGDGPKADAGGDQRRRRRAELPVARLRLGGVGAWLQRRVVRRTRPAAHAVRA